MGIRTKHKNLRGCACRAKHDMQTKGGVAFPAGTMFNIIGTHRGKLALESTVTKQIIRQVYPGEVEILLD